MSINIVASGANSCVIGNIGSGNTIHVTQSTNNGTHSQSVHIIGGHSSTAGTKPTSITAKKVEKAKVESTALNTSSSIAPPGGPSISDSATASATSTAAVASPVIAAASKQSAKKEADSKSQQSERRKDFDGLYGSYKWINTSLEKELLQELSITFGFNRDADEESINELVTLGLNLGELPRVAILVYPILEVIGKEFAAGKTEVGCQFSINNAMSYLNLPKLFSSLKITLVSMGNDRHKFTWVKDNEYLTWWQKGGSDLFYKFIIENPIRNLYTKKPLTLDFPKVTIIK